MIKLKQALPILIVFTLPSFAEDTMTCEQAKKHAPTLTIQQQLAAYAFYENEREYAAMRGDNYRSKEEIEGLFKKLIKIEKLSIHCNLAVEDITPQKYFELTGEEF